MQRELDHPGWDDSWPTPTSKQIDDLEEYGFLRVEPRAPNTNNRTFELAKQGVRVVRSLIQAPDGPDLLSSNPVPSLDDVLAWFAQLDENARADGPRLLHAAAGRFAASHLDAVSALLFDLEEARLIKFTNPMATLTGWSASTRIGKGSDFRITVAGIDRVNRPQSVPPGPPLNIHGEVPPSVEPKLVESKDAPSASSAGADTDAKDAFISHAGDDKATVAEPLARALSADGWNVWLDKLELTVGDSLNQRINTALARSRFGIVILSKAFFSKHWPKRELDALTARETVSGEKVILPVWHGVDATYLAEVSPTLADRVGVSTDHGLEYVAQELIRALEQARTAPHNPSRKEPVIVSVNRVPRNGPRAARASLTHGRPDGSTCGSRRSCCLARRDGESNGATMSCGWGVAHVSTSTTCPRP